MAISYCKPTFTPAQMAALEALGDAAGCPDCGGMGLGPMEAAGGEPHEPSCTSCGGNGLSDAARAAIKGAP